MTQTIIGHGIKSKRPFSFEFRRYAGATKVRALHETGTATVVAYFSEAEFLRLNRCISQRIQTHTEIEGTRSRGDQLVTLKVTVGRRDFKLSFVDVSGKITNTTVFRLSEWDKISQATPTQDQLRSA